MCPVTFEITDILTLSKYGIFTKQRVWGQIIPAASAVTIAASDIYDSNGQPKPYTGAAAYATHPVRVKANHGIIIERFNFGRTSRPDKVYYEIWQWGTLLKQLDLPQFLIDGYHCGNFIGHSDEDNPSTHPVVADRVELRTWNATGASPEAVWYEFAVWYYMFDIQWLDEIYETTFEKMFGNIHTKMDSMVAAQKETNRLLADLAREVRMLRPPVPLPLPR